MGFSSDINDISDNTKVGNTAKPKNGVGSVEETEANFFNMLIAQLQNQDPTNPMKNNEMTSQITQIQTVKGINALNTTVNGLVGQIDSKKYLDAVALKGREVSFSGDHVELFEVKNSEEVGDEAEKVTSSSILGFELYSPAVEVNITVRDKNGNAVHQMNLKPPIEAGIHGYRWNGLGTEDKKCPPGTYTFSVEAKNANGPIASTPLMSAAVVAVSNTKPDPLLTLTGNNEVVLDDIKQIF